jgi:hypothetical protein
VEIKSRELFDKENTTVAEFSLDLDFTPCIDEMFEMVGGPYDYLGLLGQGWVLFGRVFGKLWSNPLQRDDAWYCAELVAHFLQEAGDTIPYEPSQVSPGLLLSILENSKHAIRLDRPELPTLP